ncbi:Hypothetical protein NTJ_08892 [Nesidiocoris tenuis]|uniref:Uncharacterized protein n=1 Tax=Nesidiocoris tenuis TaxID=355587 RepID=A0ABN7AVV9_9HEMI|nr:Hypothetical protein NTJ_08892 [Nesidiocoris tenuis]
MEVRGEILGREKPASTEDNFKEENKPYLVINSLEGGRMSHLASRSSDAIFLPWLLGNKRLVNYNNVTCRNPSQGTEIISLRE